MITCQLCYSHLKQACWAHGVHQQLRHAAGLLLLARLWPKSRAHLLEIQINLMLTQRPPHDQQVIEDAALQATTGVATSCVLTDGFPDRLTRICSPTMMKASLVGLVSAQSPLAPCRRQPGWLPLCWLLTLCLLLLLAMCCSIAQHSTVDSRCRCTHQLKGRGFTGSLKLILVASLSACAQHQTSAWSTLGLLVRSVRLHVQ